MIQNDLELKCTQERIAWFEGLVAQFRVSVPPENFPAMHDEVMEYLKNPANQPLPAEAA